MQSAWVMKLNYAVTEVGEGGKRYPTLEGSVEVETVCDDLWAWLADLQKVDRDYKLYYDTCAPKSIFEELMPLFDDQTDSLKKFAKKRTDKRLAAVVSMWKDYKKDDGQTFHFSSITHSAIVVAEATTDDHGDGSSFGLSTVIDSKELGKMVSDATDSVVTKLDRQFQIDYEGY